MWGYPHPIYPTSANRISRKFTSSIMYSPTPLREGLRRPLSVRGGGSGGRPGQGNQRFIIRNTSRGVTGIDTL
jgi:hypothetical protein